MLTQFRRCYPQGSLISELLAIDHGKYIVRALVQVAGVTLATGLAAADTVEEAEDQARNRALALIELNPTINREIPAKTAAIQPNFAPISPRSQFVPKATQEVKENQLTATPAHNILEFSPLQAEVDEEKPENNHLQQPSDMIDTAFAANSNEETEEEQPSSVNASLDNSLTIIDTTPQDFSDVIAKTTLEMKRLGWTNEQGRDYLLETYGKRSRQLLSDAELVEFLQYLESQ